MSRNKASRRDFLKKASAASAGILGFPYFVRAEALGKDGATAPSNRIVFGCIGTGGQGCGDMEGFMGFKEVQVVAVCDVDKEHVEHAAKLVNKKYGNSDCKTYHNFQELVRRTDIDAVTVTTPDHWHALCSVAALNAGKDVYCEKPLANSVAEGRAISDAAKNNKRVLQTGSQERSGDNARAACDLIQQGGIGKLHTIRINLPCVDGHHVQVRKMNHQPAIERPIPEALDWDFWLGHTPKVPYNWPTDPKDRCHFYWRFILAHGGGEMTDRGAHVIDIGQLGNGTDDTGPVEFVAKGKREPGPGPFNVFWDYHFECTYANGVKMIGTAEEPRGVKFEGANGWIMVHIHGQRLEASSKDLLAEINRKIEKNDVKIGLFHGQHQRNFLDSIKSRKQPTAQAETGHRTASLCHLNNIAMAVERPIKWDPKSEQIIGDEEASKLLKPRMRSPWHL